MKYTPISSQRSTHMKKKQYAELKDKFPKLWAENRSTFSKFFNKDGVMNALGHKNYDEVKKLHRLRVMKH